MNVLRVSLSWPVIARCATAWLLAAAVHSGLPMMGMFVPLTRTAVADEPKTGFRQLAPGVLTVIPPNTSSDSNAQRSDLLEITRRLPTLAWTPKQAAENTTLVERAKNREFVRDIWCLEFAFKPPRLIDVDVPTRELRMQRKRLWYLVYRVRNISGRRTVIDKSDPSDRKTEPVEMPVRFVPHFVLESMEGLTEAEGETAYRGYLDRVIPSAMGPIRRREDPSREFFDSASMAASDIPSGGERWGVAVWEDIDPRLDFFSISIRGLTNAIRWREQPGAKFAGNLPPGAEMEHALESLRLDFWRPGDDKDEVEEEMSVGYAGMFERLTLGGKLLEALSRPGMVKSQPVAGLAELGLTWADLVVQDGDEGAVAAGGVGSELLSLAKAVQKIADIKESTARGPVVRAVFGDLGFEYFEELSRALAAPVSPERDTARRQALTGIGLSPEAVGQKPLESLAKVFTALDGIPAAAPRQQRTEALFGAAAPRVNRLCRELAMARTLAALEDVDVNRQLLPAGDGSAAFAVIRPAIDAEKDPDSRRRLLAGLFGSQGPMLYDKATEVPEGIDHTWVFRYENDGDGP